MRIMVDTNVLLSALLFPSDQMNNLVYKITTEHQLVLSSYVVDELLEVTRRKFSSKVEAVDLFVSLEIISPSVAFRIILQKNCLHSLTWMLFRVML